MLKLQDNNIVWTTTFSSYALMCQHIMFLSFHSWRLMVVMILTAIKQDTDWIKRCGRIEHDQEETPGCNLSGGGSFYTSAWDAWWCIAWGICRNSKRKPPGFCCLSWVSFAVTLQSVNKKKRKKRKKNSSSSGLAELLDESVGKIKDKKRSEG